MRRSGILVLLAISILMFSAGNAMAYGDDSSKVVMICPSGIVDDGTDVTIELHTYNKAVYTKPSVIQAFDSMTMDEISLTEKSDGLWTGTVEAKTGKAISSNLEIEEMQDTGGLLIKTKGAQTTEDTDVVIEPKDENALVNPQVGDKLDFTVSVYKDGKLRDENALEVWIDRDDTSDPSKLAINKVSTGVYETSYTVPQVTESTNFDLEARIGWWTHDQIGFEVNFFQVWFHKNTLTTTDATFDIYVADFEGKAVDNAVVELDFSYEQTDGGYESDQAGQATTDKDGKTSYTIAYTKVDGEIWLDGTVVKDAKTQHFSGGIIITSSSSGIDNDPEEPIGLGFEVIYQGGPLDVIKPGSKKTLGYKAFYNDAWIPKVTPYADKDIWYYAYTYAKVVKVGNAKTDSNGAFNIEVSAPSLGELTYDTIIIDFEGEVSPGNFKESTDYRVIAPSSLLDILNDPEKLRDTGLQISVDNLRVGGKSDVSASLPSVDKGTKATVGWVPEKITIEELMNWGDVQPEWEQLVGSDYNSMSGKEGKFKATIVIPEFMPKTTYTVFVIAIEPTEDMDEFVNFLDYYHVNYIHLKAGEGGTTPPPNGNGDEDGGLLGLGHIGGIDVAFLLIAIIIAIVVVVVIAVVATRKRSSAPPPGQPPMGPGPYTQPAPVQPTQQQPPQYPPPQQPPPAEPYQPPPQQPGASNVGGEYSPPPPAPPVDPNAPQHQGQQPPPPY